VKTAISIPDEVFEAAEKLAARLGLSRSQLYATAVREYVQLRDRRAVTAQLDAVYEHADSGLELQVAEAQAASLDDEDW